MGDGGSGLSLQRRARFTFYISKGADFGRGWVVLSTSGNDYRVEAIQILTIEEADLKFS